MGIPAYDVTAALNTTIAGINIDENCDPDTINDAIRALMADLKKLSLDYGGANTTGGAADAQTLTTNSGYTAYYAGMLIVAELGFTNTSTTPTLNVDTIGAKTVVKGANSALAAGDMLAGMTALFTYDADNDKLVLLNPVNGTAAASYLSNVSEDTTPSLGGPLDGDGFDLNDMGVLFMREQAAAEADVAGQGQWWVKTATPNVPMFTDDAGTDFQLATTADLGTFLTEQADSVWEAGVGTTPSVVAPDAIAAAIAALASSTDRICLLLFSDSNIAGGDTGKFFRQGSAGLTTLSVVESMSLVPVAGTITKFAVKITSLSGATTFVLKIRVNGVVQSTHSGLTVGSVVLSPSISVAAGDYVEVEFDAYTGTAPTAGEVVGAVFMEPS